MTTDEFADYYAQLNRALVRTMSFKFGRERAEDVAQQAWMKAFAARDTFRADSLFATWLTRIAINEGLTMARAAKRQPTERADGVTQDVINKHASDDRTEQRLIAEQEISRRSARVAQLHKRDNRGAMVSVVHQIVKQRYADIYRMRFVIGMNVKATADALHMNANTVRTYTSRIRLKLAR